MAGAVALLASDAGKIGAVLAQGAPPVGILADGNAAVTGFSGTTVPASVPVGANPDDKTYIDLNGPSMRVIDLQYMGAPPQAQLVTAPKPFTATAAQIGQVFGIALDQATAPNIYVAATSSFGLPIVVPDADGDGLPDRAKQGAPNASFMAGLWGPAAQGGGPGSIWRINGMTGAVTLFTNVTLNGVANSGPALGALAFDRTSNSLYAADRDTGMIHQFDLNGAQRGIYDHGAQGRPAAGLPAVPHDPAKRLDITNPFFKTEDPGTWAYAPPARLIFGLAVHNGRLFYAVAENMQIWSVALGEGGAFGSDARIEVQVPPGPGVTESSRITFDPAGRMLLAERPASTGSYNFDPLAQEGVGRVLRYAPVRPAGPGLPPTWQAIPDEYAIGFPAQLRNDNGGTAVGYGYDTQGRLNRQSCGFLWSTGEQLRNAIDPALAAQLSTQGTLIVNGLQGNGLELVRPANVPPLKTYFIDYNDHFDAADVRGHLADIVIRTRCEGRLQGWLPLPVWPPTIPPGPPKPPPPLTCPPGTSTQIGIQCCPPGFAMGTNGVCRSYCPAGVLVDGSPQGQANLDLCTYGFDPRTFDPANKNSWVCVDGSAPNPAVLNDPNPGIALNACVDHSLYYDPPVCKAGEVKTTVAAAYGPTGNPALDNMTICAPTPQQSLCSYPEQVSPIDGLCHLLCPNGNGYPTTQCCPVGSVPNPFGQCTCYDGKLPNPYTGKCAPSCPPNQLLANGYCCPAGQKPSLDRLRCVPVDTCPQGQKYKDGCCPTGQKPSPDGLRCVPVDTCPDARLTSTRVCCPDWLVAGGRNKSMCICPDGSTPNRGASGAAQCVQHPACPAGQHLNADNKCVCANNQPPNPLTGQCGIAPTACPVGTKRYTPNGPCLCPNQRPPVDGVCPSAVPTDQCRSGYRRVGGQCCLIGQITSSGICCPSGQKPQGAQCVSSVDKPKKDKVLICTGGQVPDGKGNCITPRPRIICVSPQVPDGRGGCKAPVARPVICARPMVPDGKGGCMLPARR